jgi:hypothetical protein
MNAYIIQQEGGVSVPMSDGQIITPNSKIVMYGQSGYATSSASSPKSLFDSLVSFLQIYSWVSLKIHL